MSDYSLWTWENIIEAARDNQFIDTILWMWESDGSIDKELALIGMVLLQDNALRNIGKLQESGKIYGDYTPISAHASNFDSEFFEEYLKLSREQYASLDNEEEYQAAFRRYIARMIKQHLQDSSPK